MAQPKSAPQRVHVLMYVSLSVISRARHAAPYRRTIAELKIKYNKMAL